MATTPTRRRMDPAERRALILEEALQLFEKQHFSTVSIRQIAAACGVNMALIYHYFDSKDDLVRAALRHAIDSFVADFAALPGDSDHPLGRASAWLDATISGAAGLARMVKLMQDFAAAGNRDEAAAEMIDDFYRRERETLEGAIRAGIAEGRFRPVDAARSARLASLALDGIFYAGPVRGDQDVAGDIGALRDQLLDYLAPAPPPGGART